MRNVRSPRQKAPAKIVDAEREKLEGYRVSTQKIREQLSQ